MKHKESDLAVSIATFPNSDHKLSLQQWVAQFKETGEPIRHARFCVGASGTVTGGQDGSALTAAAAFPRRSFALGRPQTSKTKKRAALSGSLARSSSTRLCGRSLCRWLF